MRLTDKTTVVLTMDNGLGETYRLEGLLVDSEMRTSTGEVVFIPTIKPIKAVEQREAFYDR